MGRSAEHNATADGTGADISKRPTDRILSPLEGSLLIANISRRIHEVSLGTLKQLGRILEDSLHLACWYAQYAHDNIALQASSDVRHIVQMYQKHSARGNRFLRSAETPMADHFRVAFVGTRQISLCNFGPDGQRCIGRYFCKETGPDPDTPVSSCDPDVKLTG